MALDNLISVQFTDEETVALDGHFDGIDAILKSKCISLTPEQRQSYARLGNKSENWSRKVLNYMNTQPNLTPAFIEYDETVTDFEARQTLQPRAARGEAIMDMMNDTLLLLGADVYHSCIAYYRNIRLLARQNVVGAKAIYEDLSAQFPGKNRR